MIVLLELRVRFLAIGAGRRVNEQARSAAKAARLGATVVRSRAARLLDGVHVVAERLTVATATHRKGVGVQLLDDGAAERRRRGADDGCCVVGTRMKKKRRNVVISEFYKSRSIADIFQMVIARYISNKHISLYFLNKSLWLCSFASFSFRQAVLCMIARLLDRTAAQLIVHHLAGAHLAACANPIAAVGAGAMLAIRVALTMQQFGGAVRRRCNECKVAQRERCGIGCGATLVGRRKGSFFGSLDGP